MRYSPVFTNMGMLANNISSTPDRLQLGRIAPQTVGEKMKYTPIDTNYLASQIGQQASENTRALMDTSGANRGIAQAALLSSNRGSQEALADAMFKANQLNDEKLRTVQEFNRQTGMFNAQQDLQGQRYNTDTFNQEQI